MDDNNIIFTKSDGDGKNNCGTDNLNPSFNGTSGFNSGGSETFNVESQNNKKKFLKWGIIIGIVVIIIAVISFAVYSVTNKNEKPKYVGGNPYVGVLHIEGVIKGKSNTTSTYQQKWLLDQIDAMKKDPSNKGILLYVDSPGGEVNAADELYLKIMEYRKKTKRPVHAYYANISASGAYYVSANADTITANRCCMTGSIGVYLGPLIDASGLLNKLGIHAEMIKSSKNKAMGNNIEPLTDEQRAIMQSQIDEIYEQFVEIVAEGRKMDLDKVKQIADGRVYTSKQALKVGLIDKIGDFNAAKKSMRKVFKDKVRFENIEYEPSSNLYSNLFGLMQQKNLSGLSETQIALKLLKDYESPKLMMLMSE